MPFFLTETPIWSVLILNDLIAQVISRDSYRRFHYHATKKLIEIIHEKRQKFGML